MNDKVRALQREWDEKHAEASALTSKAEPSQADSEKAAALITRIKAIQGEIDHEFKVASQRTELAGLKTAGTPEVSDEKRFMHAGRSEKSSAALLGYTPAGKVSIDSYGSAIDDFKGGGDISPKQWVAMQDPVYTKAFMSWLRAKGAFNSKALGDSAYYKALQEGLDDQGGVFVPPEMLQRVISREPTPTRVAGKVTTITTSRDRVSMPRTQYSADDLYTTAFRVAWTGEVPSSSTASDVDDANLFGDVGIDVFTAMISGSITNDMAEDAFFPLQGWIENQFRITDQLLRDNISLNGTGRTQGNGMLNNAGASDPSQPTVVLSGVSAGLSGDSIVDLPYQIPEQYIDNCEWVFNRTSTERYIAKLKDGQNNYLFSSGWENRGIANARPTDLVGFPICRSGFMPNIGASNYPIIFGDLRAYYLVNRLGITFQVLRETKAKLNQFEIVARLRFGGKTVEPWKLRIMKSNNS